jgi:hypothetical protein
MYEKVNFSLMCVLTSWEHQRRVGLHPVRINNATTENSACEALKPTINSSKFLQIKQTDTHLCEEMSEHH